MKWGILATGTIARKFADTVNHMNPEAEKLIACASRNLEHGKAFAEKYGNNVEFFKNLESTYISDR